MRCSGPSLGPHSTSFGNALQSGALNREAMFDENCVGDEAARTKLIDELGRIVRDPAVPCTAKAAGLTLIGWLARRKPSEPPHALGLHEARESEGRLRAARQR